jgi:hypothetical protein
LFATPPFTRVPELLLIPISIAPSLSPGALGSK